MRHDIARHSKRSQTHCRIAPSMPVGFPVFRKLPRGRTVDSWGKTGRPGYSSSRCWQCCLGCCRFPDDGLLWVMSTVSFKLHALQHLPSAKASGQFIAGVPYREESPHATGQSICALQCGMYGHGAIGRHVDTRRSPMMAEYTSFLHKGELRKRK